MTDTPRTNSLSDYGPATIDDLAILCRQLERELNELRAENERLRKDAERYHFLRDSLLTPRQAVSILNDSPQGIEKSIDQAMRRVK